MAEIPNRPDNDYDGVLDDLVGDWHEATEPGPPLHDHLGMTEKRYAAWVEGRYPEDCAGGFAVGPYVFDDGYEYDRTSGTKIAEAPGEPLALPVDCAPAIGGAFVPAMKDGPDGTRVPCMRWEERPARMEPFDADPEDIAEILQSATAARVVEREDEPAGGEG